MKQCSGKIAISRENAGWTSVLEKPVPTKMDEFLTNVFKKPLTHLSGKLHIFMVLLTFVFLASFHGEIWSENYEKLAT